MLVPNLFPVPKKDVKYLQGFHPVPEGLFPQSLQETPEGVRESKHLQISVYTCGWLGSKPPGDTGHSPDVRMSSSFSLDHPQGNSVGWGHPAVPLNAAYNP